jgi:sterol 3beta-glucosyltransferase
LNVTIATFGSRGDIQPLLAPALGLQRAGHRATIVVLQDLERWALAYGVAVHPMKFNVREFMRNPETAAALKGRKTSFAN